MQKQSKQYRLLIALSLLLSLIGMPFTARAADEMHLYGIIEHFTWKEFLGNGRRVVKESGPLFGAGFSITNEMERQLIIKVKGELFGGQVDYDGHTQPPALTPAFLDTNYFGFKGEIDLRKKFMVAETTSLEPFVGGGYRRWIRYIESGTDILGNPVGSAEEVWSHYYVRFGVRGDHQTGRATHFFVEGGIKVPVYTENDAGFVTLNPGNKASFFAEAGIRSNKIKGTAFYEGLRFSQSDPEGGWIQPESEADIFGIQVGVLF